MTSDLISLVLRQFSYWRQSEEKRHKISLLDALLMSGRERDSEHISSCNIYSQFPLHFYVLSYYIVNRSFLSCFEHHNESEANCKVFVMKTNFHMKSFALSLAFIVRFTATQKRPIAKFLLV